MAENKIAISLALLFSEEIEIPTRFKQKANEEIELKKTKFKEDSLIEQLFQHKINLWEKVITTMNSKVSEIQATRFMNLEPIVEPNTTNVTHCEDFQSFTNYFISRRDKDNCDADELGLLALLYSSFQREIQRKMATLSVQL